MSIIEANGLARTFTSRRRTVEAVRGVDLTVHDGEIVGFLGPNGAGKTTTLRMLTTLLRPTAGTATVAGSDLLRDPVGVRRRIGYVPQAIGVTAGGTDPACTVAEELAIQGRVYRLSAAETAARASLLTDQLDLTGLESRLCKTLSGGQRRRLDISLGLIHSPAVVFLDEPTTGLDPQSRSNLWDHIRDLRAKLGTTIFLTTHYLDEADALCDRVLIIDHGKIIAEGVPDELKRQISGDVVTLSIHGQAGQASQAGQAGQANQAGQAGQAGQPGQAGRADQIGQAESILAGHEGVRDIAVDGHSIRMTVEHGEQALPGMLRELDAHAIMLESIQLARPTLDDVFLTLTGRSLRDDSPSAANGTHDHAGQPDGPAGPTTKAISRTTRTSN
jgi:ABC-2 type transport system ATP-binding protein